MRGDNLFYRRIFSKILLLGNICQRDTAARWRALNLSRAHFSGIVRRCRHGSGTIVAALCRLRVSMDIDLPPVTALQISAVDCRRMLDCCQPTTCMNVLSSPSDVNILR